jgi:hypothetical protein
MGVIFWGLVVWALFNVAFVLAMWRRGRLRMRAVDTLVQQRRAIPLQAQCQHMHHIGAKGTSQG